MMKDIETERRKIAVLVVGWTVIFILAGLLLLGAWQGFGKAEASETSCRKNAFGNVECSDGAVWKKNYFGTWRVLIPPREQERREGRADECRTEPRGRLVCR